MLKINYLRKNNWLIFSATLIVCCQNGFSQKKQIDYQAYDNWKKLEKQQSTPSANWITYEINPLKGDGYLYFYNQKLNKLDSIKRVTEANDLKKRISLKVGDEYNNGIVFYKTTDNEHGILISKKSVRLKYNDFVFHSCNS